MLETVSFVLHSLRLPAKSVHYLLLPLQLFLQLFELGLPAAKERGVGAVFFQEACVSQAKVGQALGDRHRGFRRLHHFGSPKQAL